MYTIAHNCLHNVRERGPFGNMEFGVPHNTLSTWLKNSEKIKQAYKGVFHPIFSFMIYTIKEMLKFINL